MSITIETHKVINLWGDRLGKPVIVLVSGKAGVGKTTFSSMLCDNIGNYLGYTAEVCSFAREIKNVANEVFGWDGKKDGKGRKLLQDIGRVGREYNENIWATHLMNHIHAGFFPIEFSIVDDWRFTNEYFYVNKFPMFNVFGVRIIAPERETLKGTNAYYDISEVGLDGWEDKEFNGGVIYNTGTLHALDRSSIAFINGIFGKEMIK